MLLRMIFQIAAFVVVLALILFGLAGTLMWPGGWVLIGALALSGTAMTVWLARHDPALLKERMGRGSNEKLQFDRILLPLANTVLMGWIGFMAFDMRVHGTTQWPLWVNLAGGAAIVAAFALVIRVMAENTFATTFVRTQPERGQHVIATGPYAVVRHPMYSAAVLAYAAIPLALGSRAGLWGIPLPVVVLAVRILFEEQILRRDLQGYCDYMTSVRFRLVPFIW